MVVVVLGHWLMAVLGWEDGKFVGANLLELAPVAQLLTWALQVMPVFFIVGGFTNAASWESAQRRGTTYASWLRARSSRLTRPALYFVGFWCVASIVGVLAGLPSSVMAIGVMEVSLPLWFLATYLLVVAAAPALLSAHKRFGGLRLLVALSAGVVIVDMLRYTVPDLGPLGNLNHALVWLAISELGFLWRDGVVRTPRWLPWAMIGGGLVGLAALVMLADYPVSMVGLTHSERSNSLPPSLAMLVMGIGQFGAVLLCENATNRWLQRPKVWLTVAMANTMIMTFYLWNMTAVVVAVVLLYPTGIMPTPEPLSTAWWLLRPLWILACAACLTPFVLIFRRAEKARPEPEGTRPPSLAAVIIGTLAAATSFAILADGNFPVPGLPLALPVFAVGCLAAAAILLRLRPPSDDPA